MSPRSLPRRAVRRGEARAVCCESNGTWVCSQPTRAALTRSAHMESKCLARRAVKSSERDKLVAALYGDVGDAQGLQPRTQGGASVGARTCFDKWTRRRLSKQHCPWPDRDYIPLMQPSLFGRALAAELARTEHGGDFRRGRRKLERPISTKRPIHVVLTSQKARGPWDLRRHAPAVRKALRDMAHRFGIRVYDFANVGSHLHLLVRTRRRDEFSGFLRSFAGIVARRVTGARRGRPSGRFFECLAWSRVVRWGRDYLGVRHYVFRNQIEGESGQRIRRALEEGPHAKRVDPRHRTGPPLE